MDVIKLAMEMQSLSDCHNQAVDFFGLTIHELGAFMEELGTLRLKLEQLRFMEMIEREMVLVRADASRWERAVKDAYKERDEAQRACVVLGNWRRTILARMGCLLETAANGRGSFEEHLLEVPGGNYSQPASEEASRG